MDGKGRSKQAQPDPAGRPGPGWLPARVRREADELVLDWVASGDFDRLLVNTVSSTYPAHEQERFVEHLRGLVGQWVREQGRQPLWAA